LIDRKIVEEEKSRLVLEAAANKKQLAEIEDQVPRRIDR